MQQMRYVGSEHPEWKGETALIQQSGIPGYVKAQFDNLEHPQAYGWWTHPIEAFEPIDLELDDE